MRLPHQMPCCSKAKSASPNSEIVPPGNVIAYQACLSTPALLPEPSATSTSAHMVHKGQLLAVISSPEVDQRACRHAPTWPRRSPMPTMPRARQSVTRQPVGQDAVTQQDTENFTTQAQSSNTTVKSQIANVQRSGLTSFEKVYAPFNEWSPHAASTSATSLSGRPKALPHGFHPCAARLCGMYRRVDLRHIPT